MSLIDIFDNSIFGLSGAKDMTDAETVSEGGGAYRKVNSHFADCVRLT